MWGVCSPRGGGNTQGLPEQERVELGLGLLPGAGEEALHRRGERGETTPQNARVSLHLVRLVLLE